MMKCKKYFLFAFLCAVIVLLCTSCGTKEIDVSQYVKVTFEGLDGKGTASLDISDLESAIEDVILGEDRSIEDLLMYGKLLVVENAVKVELDKDQELSNGDKVTVIITADNDTAKENGVKFVGTQPIQFEVSDLQEIVKIDPFSKDVFNVTDGDGVYIDFTGISPYAEIRIRNTFPKSNPLSEVVYETDESVNEGLEKGEEIVISASAPDDWEERGYVLTAEETTVKCENVDEYVKSIDDIDDATWEKIKKQCEDLKKSEIDSKDSDIIYKNDKGYGIKLNRVNSCDNFQYSKDYFFTLKDGLSSKGYFFSKMKQNGLYISYTIDLNGAPKGFFSEEKYDVKNVCGCFSIFDLIKNKNGEIQFTADTVHIVDAIYTDEDTMEIAVLNSNLDKFDMTERDSKLKN